MRNLLNSNNLLLMMSPEEFRNQVSMRQSQLPEKKYKKKKRAEQSRKA